MARIIVAYTKSRRVIGRDGGLPWGRLYGDLVRFKRMTMGCSVVMGRKTWESLGCKPLQGRENVVVSRTLPPREGNPRILGDLAKAVFEAESPVYVIGGEAIYRQSLALGMVNQVVATEVHEDYDGDTFFPELVGFTEVSRQPFPQYDLVHYRKEESCTSESSPCSSSD